MDRVQQRFCGADHWKPCSITSGDASMSDARTGTTKVPICRSSTSFVSGQSSTAFLWSRSLDTTAIALAEMPVIETQRDSQGSVSLRRNRR